MSYLDLPNCKVNVKHQYVRLTKNHFKACPIEAKKWANNENKKLILCNYCEQPIIDYKALYENLLEKVDYYKEEIRDLYLKDSCHRYLIEDTVNKPWNLIHTINPITDPFYTEICKMVTLTFDPRKFPVLFDTKAQRLYIAESLNEFISTFNIAHLYGCYELHENGVVHSHFIIPNISEFELKFLRLKFTNNEKNEHAVHCCEKVLEDGIKYVNKKETKDIKNELNFYRSKINI